MSFPSDPLGERHSASHPWPSSPRESGSCNITPESGVGCDLHQPPDVTDESAAEVEANPQCGRGFWEISRCSTPSSLFLRNCLWGEDSWVVYTESPREHREWDAASWPSTVNTVLPDLEPLSGLGSPMSTQTHFGALTAPLLPIR